MDALVVLFDLDGTLTDPRDGIVRCIEHALARLGYKSPGEDSLARYIGPPLSGTFGELLRTDDESLIETAIATYRERFSSIGMFENRMYEGVPESLERLRSCGATLVVATSKPEVYAREILYYFGLRQWFKEVYGSELDGTLSDKKELVRHVLERERIPATHAVMVGDRRHDIVGARGNGVKAIGVLWGYGNRAELEGAGADWLCEAPAELPALVASNFPFHSGTRPAAARR